MPGFDVTGPLGQGSMTGRGLGYCGTGRTAPAGGAVYGRGRGGLPWGGGRGMGFGGGRGRGRGFGFAGFRGAYAGAPAAQDSAWLRDRASALEAELQDIKARLSELDRDS